MRKLPALARSLIVSLSALTLLACDAGKAVQDGSATNADRESPVLSTKEIMTRAHKGKQSLLSRLNADLQKPQPDWPKGEEHLAEMIRLVSRLTTQKPPQGSLEAWNTRVHDYVDNAKDIEQNLKEQNVQAARASVGKLLKTCKGCHDAHNPH